MEANNNHSKERVSAAASFGALDDTASLRTTSEDDAKKKPRPAIIRCWNDQDVSRIIKDLPETVEFYLGCHEERAPKKFSFIKALLCHFSAYYRALLMSGFKESKQDILIIDLQLIDAYSLDTWLRSGRLDFRGSDRTSRCSALVRLYKFADYHDIPALRRTIMLQLAPPDITWSHCTTLDHWELGNILFELPTSSPFYRWMVENWAFCPHKANVDNTMRLNKNIPEEFRRLVQNNRIIGPGFGGSRCCHNPCDYHEHESLEEWKRTCHLVDKDLPKPDPSTYRKPSRRP
ncbi:hypothetical protein KCU93_g4665, partial [Aureobasidium melanogenum]